MTGHDSCKAAVVASARDSQSMLRDVRTGHTPLRTRRSLRSVFVGNRACQPQRPVGLPFLFSNDPGQHTGMQASTPAETCPCCPYRVPRDEQDLRNTREGRATGSGNPTAYQPGILIRISTPSSNGCPRSRFTQPDTLNIKPYLSLSNPTRRSSSGTSVIITAIPSTS